MKTIVAILDTMWGERKGRAPRFFKINPYNKSGKRLYKFVGPENAHRLYVTNCCRELVTSANHHGKPDPHWLDENLERLNPDIVLVCGKVAEETFNQTGRQHSGCHKKIIYIPHPASRMWTKKQLRETERKIQQATK